MISVLRIIRKRCVTCANRHAHWGYVPETSKRAGRASPRQTDSKHRPNGLFPGDWQGHPLGPFSGSAACQLFNIARPSEQAARPPVGGVKPPMAVAMLGYKRDEGASSKKLFSRPDGNQDLRLSVRLLGKSTLFVGDLREFGPGRGHRIDNPGTPGQC